MVSFEEIQAAYYMVAATGVLVAVVFYIISTLNDVKARQASLFMGIYKDMTTSDMPEIATELMRYTWTNFADFQKKYDSRVNPESYSKREKLWNWFDGLGVLLKRKLLDRDLVYDKIGGGSLVQWAKWGDVINEYKKIGEIAPDMFNGFEYLAKEMASIRKNRGIVIDVHLAVKSFETLSP